MTPTVQPTRITSVGAADIWAAFAQAIGPDALRACYGWNGPPAELRPGESAWVYDDPTLPSHGFPPRTSALAAALGLAIGWGSLIKDSTTATYWHSSGVFPAFARRGYRQAIRRHLCTEAFARGAEAVSLVVLDTNKEHRDRCQREAVDGPWKASGRIWRPEPGQTIFTLLREDARLVVPFTDKACCCFHLWVPGECPSEVRA